MPNSTMTNEEILTQVNSLIQNWSKQFENAPAELPVSFSINHSNMLCANGVVLFPAQKLVPDSLAYEEESLYIASCDGEDFEIGINWRVSGPPYMLFVRKSSTLFTAV